MSKTQNTKPTTLPSPASQPSTSPKQADLTETINFLQNSNIPVLNTMAERAKDPVPREDGKRFTNAHGTGMKTKNNTTVAETKNS